MNFGFGLGLPSFPALGTGGGAGPVLLTSGSYGIGWDSRTASSTTTSGGLASAYKESLGFAAYVESILAGKALLNDNGQIGVAGNDLAAAIARQAAIDTLVAAGGRFMIYLVGVNDTATTLDDMKTRMAALCDYGKNAGLERIFVITELPNANLIGQPTLIQKHNDYRAWLADPAGLLAGRSWITPIDCYSLVTDGANGWGVDMSIDNLHPSIRGYRTMAAPIASAISPYLSVDMAPLPIDNTLWSAGAPTKSLTRNPMLTGTTGTVSAPVTGQMPTSWTAQAANSTGMTLSAAVLSATDPDGFNEIEATFSGTPTSANPSMTLQVPLDVPANTVPGDRLRARARVKWPAGIANIAGITLNMSINGTISGSGSFNNRRSLDVSPPRIYPSDLAFEGKLIATDFVVPANFITGATSVLSIIINFTQNAASTGSVRVSRPMIGKV